MVARDASTRAIVTTSTRGGNPDTVEYDFVSQGSSQFIDIDPNIFVNIQASSPIMVAQFIKGAVTGKSSDNSPVGELDLLIYVCVWGYNWVENLTMGRYVAQVRAFNILTTHFTQQGNVWAF